MRMMIKLRIQDFESYIEDARKSSLILSAIVFDNYEFNFF